MSRFSDDFSSPEISPVSDLVSFNSIPLLDFEKFSKTQSFKVFIWGDILLHRMAIE